MDKLSPGRITPRSTDEAFQLLARTSRYQQDANLCDSIANQVYSAWLARKNNDRLNAASGALEDERKRLEWNARLTAEGTKLEGRRLRKIKGRRRQRTSSTTAATQSRHANAAHSDEACRGAALIRSNQLKREVAELQVKIEFQSLIVQHFLQRRFQHALIWHAVLSQYLCGWRQPAPGGRGCQEPFCQDKRPPPGNGHDRFAGE